jgi:hypothetical protein
MYPLLIESLTENCSLLLLFEKQEVINITDGAARVS